MNKEKLLQVVIDNKLGKELAHLLYDTKKEVFDDLDKVTCYACISLIQDLKKKHLGKVKEDE